MRNGVVCEREITPTREQRRGVPTWRPSPGGSMRSPGESMRQELLVSLEFYFVSTELKRNRLRFAGGAPNRNVAISRIAM